MTRAGRTRSRRDDDLRGARNFAGRRPRRAARKFGGNYEANRVVDLHRTSSLHLTNWRSRAGCEASCSVGWPSTDPQRNRARKIRRTDDRKAGRVARASRATSSSRSALKWRRLFRASRQSDRRRERAHRLHQRPIQRRPKIPHDSRSQRRTHSRRRLQLRSSAKPIAGHIHACRSAKKTSVAEFLDALRGARLEVRGTPPISGRLLSVERKTRVSGGTTLEVEVIALVTDAGEVREVELTPATSVRLMDANLNQEVGKYLTLLASERDQDLRRMAISTTGKGERQLYVSYISEVPVWKTTYRIVLSPKSETKPLLQGWAIVDNTVGEDWNDVQLSLVAGAPQSFIMQLSQPYYATRPTVALPENVQLAPQTHEGTMRAGFSGITGTVKDPSGAVVPNTQVRLVNENGQLIATTRADSAGRYQFADLPGGTFGLEFESENLKKAIVRNIPVNASSDARQTPHCHGSATTTEVDARGGRSNAQMSLLMVTGRNLGNGRSLGASRGTGWEG